MITSPVLNTQPTDRSDLIRKTAQDFGTIFISMMLKAMRKSTGENEFMPASFGEKLYTEMLDDNYAGIISKNTLSGFHDMICKELERLDNDDNISSLKNLKNLQFSDKFAQYRTYSNNEPLLNNDILKHVNKWQGYINEASEMFGIDKNLIKAVIIKESAGNPLAISRVGAKGLMQLMDSTAMDMGVKNSFSPRDNIIGGVKYLFQMLNRFKGNEHLALASYNAGPSAVEKYNNNIPPYKETQNYVYEVLKYRDIFAQGSE